MKRLFIFFVVLPVFLLSSCVIPSPSGENGEREKHGGVHWDDRKGKGYV